MSYSTLMVHLDLAHSNDVRLQIAGDLAEQFDSKLIGVAACGPEPPFHAEFAPGALALAAVEEARASLKKQVAETEQRFREQPWQARGLA